MKDIVDNDTIQIEITNFCFNNCANCTRFVKHFNKPYFMKMDVFRKAVDSLIGFPHMVGVMGGEPLAHPGFVEMCQYLSSKFRPEQCGLWSCFPTGYEKYRDVICKTFGNVFVNDHTREDIAHHPFLVSAREIKGLSDHDKWRLIERCPFQKSWSASINPHGAFFCEMAASLSMLLDDHFAWKVVPGWWEKTSKDYKYQMEHYCMLCGGAIPLQKRISTTVKDEISPQLLEVLMKTSPKVSRGEYIISDCKVCFDESPMATYKDQTYRDNIAARYGMFLEQNDKGFLTPYLSRKWKGGDTNEHENQKS